MGIRPEGYVEELMRTVGLENTDRKKPAGSYSLGMWQRLGIGLALVGDPKLLVLDEPITGLDPQGIAEVRQILMKLRDGKGTPYMPDQVPRESSPEALRAVLVSAVTIGVFLALSIRIFDRRDVK
jgi:ABC-type branched-subunit amino acid transport system ATPase component